MSPVAIWRYPIHVLFPFLYAGVIIVSRLLHRCYPRSDRAELLFAQHPRSTIL